MNYNKNSFLAGLSVGRTLKGWSGGSGGGGKTEGFLQNWSLLAHGEGNILNAPNPRGFGFGCGVYYVVFNDGSGDSFAYTSADGAAWTKNPVVLRSGRSLGATYAYGNNLYVNHTYGSNLAVTKDFVSWSEKTIPFGLGSLLALEFKGDIAWVIREYENPPPSSGGEITYPAFTSDFEQYTTLPTIPSRIKTPLTTPIGFVARFLLGDNVASMPRWASSVAYVENVAENSIYSSFLKKPVIISPIDDQTISVKTTIDFSNWESVTVSLLQSDNASLDAYQVDDGSLWITRDNGNTYAITKDLSEFYTASPPFTSKDPTFFRGTYFLIHGRRIYSSENLAAWSEVADVDEDIYNLFIADNVIFATGAGIYNYAGSFASLDGKNWEALPINPSSVFGKDGVFIANVPGGTLASPESSIYITIR